MRLKITPEIGKISFSIYCDLAYYRIESRKEELCCYIPDNLRDPSCTFELVFQEEISKFDKITIDLRELTFGHAEIFHTIILQRECEGSPYHEIKQGYIAYMEDRSVNSKKRIEEIEKGTGLLYRRM
jgi:hypothetical protein